MENEGRLIRQSCKKIRECIKVYAYNEIVKVKWMGI